MTYVVVIANDLSYRVVKLQLWLAAEAVAGPQSSVVRSFVLYPFAARQRLWNKFHESTGKTQLNEGMGGVAHFGGARPSIFF